MKENKGRKVNIFGIIVLSLLMLAAALVIFLNASAHREETIVPTAAPVPVIADPEVTPEPTAEPIIETEPEPTSAPVPESFTAPVKVRDFVYTQSSYQAITDILAEFRYNGTAAIDKMHALTEVIKSENAQQGAVWENIINYWIYVNTELQLNYDVLPDGLAEDNSLCIVILGFRLEPDGSMSEELVRRCEVGLAAANKYPNAYIAVTGGGTATRSSATEAEVMADWLEEHGVDRERIITENESQTTGENAEFTLAIIRDNFPQIRDIAIVSSGYHIPEGSLVFYEETQLNAYKYDIPPLNIVSNACADMGFSYYGNVHSQASYIWELAEVKY